VLTLTESITSTGIEILKIAAGIAGLLFVSPPPNHLLCIGSINCSNFLLGSPLCAALPPGKNWFESWLAFQCFSCNHMAIPHTTHPPTATCHPEHHPPPTSHRRGKQPSSKSRWLLQMSSISIPLRIPKLGFVSRRISNPFRFALFWSTPRGQVRSVRLMPHHLQRESGKSEKRESDANYPTSTRRASQVNRLRLSPPSDVVCGPVPSLIWPNGCQDECQRKVDSASFLICWMNPFVGCMLIIF